MVQQTKQQQAEEVMTQNRIDYLKSEHDRLQMAKDQLSNEIARKSSDYELYIGQKDAESKRLRQDAMETQEQLQKDKSEFQSILQNFKKEKELFDEQKKQLDLEKSKIAGRMEQIGHFIQAVQRDISVLGL